MATDKKFVDKQFDRRKMLGGTAVAGLGIFGGGMFFGNATAAPSSGMTRSFTAGLQELPADAAPAESQIYKIASNSSIAKVLDFYARVYERAEGASDLFSESLVKVDKNFQIQPGAAESWEGSEDGLTWTFKIREGLMWSDGNPVTANDWVASFQNGANPEFAWDFTWFFRASSQIGTKRLLVRCRSRKSESRSATTTTNSFSPPSRPAPYIAGDAPLLIATFEGRYRGVRPALQHRSGHSDFVGPYILAEWLPDQSVRIVRNEAYTGDHCDLSSMRFSRH